MTSLSSVYMGDELENGRGAKGSGALRLDQKPDPLGGHWTFWVIRFLEKLFSKMAGLPPPLNWYQNDHLCESFLTN